MSLVAIRSALETALAAMSPSLPTVWQNDLPADPGSGPYQRADLLMGQPINAEYGARSIKQGVFQITLCWPTGVNTAGVDERCDLIEQAFPRGLSLTSGPYVVTIQRTAEILPGYRDADRWCVPVRLRFFCQSIVPPELELAAQLGAYALGLGYEMQEVSASAYVLSNADAGKFLTFTSADPVFVYVDAGLDADFACAVCKAGAGDVTVWDGTASVTHEDGNYTLTSQGAFGVVRRISGSASLFQRGEAQPSPVVINRTLYNQPEASGLIALLLT